MIEYPYNLEAEENLIGCYLVRPELFSKTYGQIKNYHFYNKNCKNIFEVIEYLFRADKQIDIVNVSEELITRLKKPANDVRMNINDIALGLISTAMYQSYMNIIIEKFKQRELLQISEQIQKAIIDNKKTDEIVRDTNSLLYNISFENDKKEGISLVELLTDRYSDIAISYEDFRKDNSEVKIANVFKTGIKSMDLMLKGGLRTGHLTLIAARSRVGKTLFEISLEHKLLENNENLPICVFQLEQDKTETSDRHFGCITGINKYHFTYVNKLRDESFGLLSKAISKVSDYKYKYFDHPDFDILEIESKSNQFFTECGKKGIIIIDNLNLIEDIDKGRNEIEVTSNITRQAKKLAKKLDCNVILLCQLNKEAEITDKNRKTTKPSIGNIRGSGQIIANADQIILLHRDTSNSDDIQEMLAIFEKCRGGKVGEINLTVDLSTNQIIERG